MDADECSSFLSDSTEKVDLVVLRHDLIKDNQLIIEVSGEVDVAVLQCGMYMIRASEKLGNKQIIYRFCSNGMDWNFMTYDPTVEQKENRFKILYRMDAILPGMEYKSEVQEKNELGETIEKEVYTIKATWIRRCSELVQVIYSCLYIQLKEQKSKLDLVQSLLNGDGLLMHPNEDEEESGKTLLLFKAPNYGR